MTPLCPISLANRPAEGVIQEAIQAQQTQVLGILEG